MRTPRRRPIQRLLARARLVAYQHGLCSDQQLADTLDNRQSARAPWWMAHLNYLRAPRRDILCAAIAELREAAGLTVRQP